MHIVYGLVYLHVFTSIYRVFILCKAQFRNWEYRSDQTTPNPFSHGTGTLVVSVCVRVQWLWRKSRERGSRFGRGWVAM